MEPISPDSYWFATTGAAVPHYPQLPSSLRTEVVIIGAGITGLTAALHLKLAGKQVVVLEAGQIGSGTSGGTTGHLDIMPDQGFSTLINDFGEDAARRIIEARRAAIDQIEAWCLQYQIDCDFVRVPAYAYTEYGNNFSQMEQEYQAARRLGVDVQLVRDVPLPFPCAGGLRIERLARFHSLRYLLGLAAQVHGDNATIYENTRAEPPEDGQPCRVKTSHGEIRADHVIVATHSAYFGISQLDMRMTPTMSYVVTVEVDRDLEDALYWDDAEPYHYTRRAETSEPRRLIIGGADHKTGQGGDERQHYDKLEHYARQRFHVVEVHERWSSELFEPSDGVAFIGRLPMHRNLYVGTGYSGTGLTWGTAAGRLLADLILNRSNTLAEIVSPARLKLMAGGAELLQENLDVARRFVMDRFAGERIQSLDAIARGEGKLIRYNGKLLAAYREQDGLLHTFSPVCTHSGCIVHWNEAEKTWDCPCHGGRYDCKGERIYGPPSRDLPREQPHSA